MSRPCAVWRRLLIMVVMGVLACAGATQAAEPEVTLSSTQAEWVRTHPTIVLALYGDAWPPYEMEEDGATTGLAVDYLSTLTQRLGMRVEQRRYATFPALWEAVCRGEADVLVNVTFHATLTRCLAYGRPYATTPVAVVGRAHDARLGDPDLRGLRIVLRDHAPELEPAQARYVDATIETVGTEEDALRAVSDGRADVYLGNAQVAQLLLAERGLTGLMLVRQADLRPDQQHFAVPTSKRPLIEALDAAWLEMTAQERAAINARWLRPLDWQRHARPALGRAESDVLAHPLRLAVLPNAQPLSFINAEGQPGGLVAAYVDRLTDLGAQFEVSPTADYTTLVRRMDAGEVDVVVGFPVEDDGSGDAVGWVYSRPFVSIPNVIVTRTDGGIRVLGAGDLSGRRVAVPGRKGLHRHLVQAAPGLQTVDVTGAVEGLRLLARGDVDAYVGNLAVADQLIRDRYPGRLQIAAPAGLDYHLAVAVRAPYAPLATTFDRVLDGLGPAGQAEIRNTWLAAEYTDGLRWQEVARWIALVMVLGAVPFSILLFAYWRIRREVGRRERAEGRLDDVTSYLPAVVYQVRREVDGRLSFPFIFGDVEALFGVATQAALDDERTLFASLHPDDQGVLVRAMEAAAPTAATLDIEFRTRDGAGWRWIRSRARGMRADAGVVLWSGYWIDVTQARLQAEALAAAVAVRSEFLATMSHEIRTPMAGILGLLEVMEHGTLDVEQRQVLRTIDDSAQLLRQLLDDILDLSRLEAGAMQLEPRPADLRALSGNVVQVLRTVAHEKGLRLDLHVDPEVSAAHLVDGMRLRQVLFNLLSNAIKFTPSGCVGITIAPAPDDLDDHGTGGQNGDQAGDQVGAEEASATRDDVQGGTQQVLLVVKDTGIGIAPAQQAALFAPFSQAHRSISREYGGTGLGLSICRRLIEQMGGTITLHSVVNVGTQVQVRVCLPVVSAEEVTAIDGAVAGQGKGAGWGDGARLRVLVAEDQLVNQAVMVWRMQQVGIPCVMVENGEQALAALGAEHFDLLITDCRMPCMDGYALAETIRAQEQSTGQPRLPILAMTASGMADQIARCMAAGMDEVLVKPATLEQLREALARWLPAAGQQDGGDVQDMAAATMANVANVANANAEAAGSATPGAGAAAFWRHLDGMGSPQGAAAQFGSVEAYLRLLRMSVADGRQALAALRTALEHDGGGDVDDHLHAIAGVLGVVGATSIAEHARDLMEAIELDGLGDTKASIQVFSEELAVVLDELDAAASC